MTTKGGKKKETKNKSCRVSVSVQDRNESEHWERWRAGESAYILTNTDR